MDNSIYWIWLQNLLGSGSRFVNAVLEQPGGARFAYERTVDDLYAMGCFQTRIIDRLSDKSLDTARRIMERCELLDYSIVTPDSPMYPDRLRSIAGPPAVLYVQGKLPAIDDEVCVAIVGTRTASIHGTAAAQELALRLTKAGAVIVSGAARGIDTAAHQGALMAGGPTVAVLGCGIDYRYNMEGKSLRDAIAHHGAVVSEYPPGTASRAENFPIRNRIISALSLGVAVIEAGKRSGSLLTANLALEQGRDVFAIPGSIGDINSLGVNQLLHDGAIPLLSPLDVIQEYASHYPHKLSLNGTEKALLSERPARTPAPNIPQEAYLPVGSQRKALTTDIADAPAAKQPDVSIRSSGLSDGARRMYARLTSEGDSVDTLAADLGMETRQVLCLLTELELEGMAESIPGRRFRR